MPYLFIPTGIFNLRIEDVIVLLLLLLNFKGVFRPPSNSLFRRNKTWLLITGYVLFSFLFKLSTTAWVPNGYAVVTYFGSILTLYVLSCLFANPDYFTAYMRGIPFALLSFLGTFISQYQQLVALNNTFKYSHQFKSAMQIEGLNPNAYGVISLLLASAGFISVFSYIWSRDYIKIGVLLLSITMMTIPFFTFVRGASFGMLVIAILFLLYLFFFTRKKRYKLLSVLLVLLLSYASYQVYNSNNSLIQSALNINLHTGEGFSGRFYIWNSVFKYVLPIAPILGHGFTYAGQAIDIFSPAHGVAHNMILMALIELGLPMAIIYIGSILWEITLKLIAFFRKPYCPIYMVQFAFLLGLFITDLGGQNLYFTKYGFIVLALCSAPIYTDRFLNKNEKNSITG